MLCWQILCIEVGNTDDKEWKCWHYKWTDNGNISQFRDNIQICRYNCWGGFATCISYRILKFQFTIGNATTFHESEGWAPVMLLRNLRGAPGYGLRNGTWLIVLKLGMKVFEAEIASGVNKGKCVVIPRITLAPPDTELPSTLRRHQFPVRPCFAMTTNKAQGQTLDFVGIYLPDHVFSHGQLCVALSRVCIGSAMAVCVNNPDGYTKNTVYREVLCDWLSHLYQVSSHVKVIILHCFIYLCSPIILYHV